MNSLLRLSAEQLLPLLGGAYIYIPFSVVPKGFLPERLGGIATGGERGVPRIPTGALLETKA